MDDSEKAPDTTDGITSATQGVNVAHPSSGDRIVVAGNVVLPNPYCYGMQELPNAANERTRVAGVLTRRTKSNRNSDGLPKVNTSQPDSMGEDVPLFVHLSQGLAYTIGSALGTKAPSVETCLAAFIVPNSNGLTAGSRAWSKHAHRSQPLPLLPPDHDTQDGHNSPISKEKLKQKKAAEAKGWWGIASGPVGVINEKALALFWRVMNGASWRNLHWLPHQVLVYEVRVPEGYGIRWSQDQGDRKGSEGGKEERKEERKEDCPWMFRGFLEPTMEDGHEMRWRHPVSPS